MSPRDDEAFLAERRDQQRAGLRQACLLAGPLLVSFSLLDWFAAPTHFEELLSLRVLVAAGLAVLAGLLERPRPMVPFALLAVALVLAPVVAGAAVTGGASSVYAPTVMIVIATTSVLGSFGPRFLALLGAEAIALTAGPLAFAPGSTLRGELTLTAVLATMSIVAVVGGWQMERILRQEHRARSEAAGLLRLSNLGLLAAGLAHDLANPLSAVMLELQRLERKGDSSLANAQRALGRMRQIVASMRRGAQPGEAERRPANVKDELDEILVLVGPRLRHLSLVLDVQPVPPVLADPVQLGQLLTNLLLNAADALEGVTGARLRVRLAEEPGTVVLEVADNGPGVPAEARERIFEPFVTTKGAKGTGLGLWVCREITRAHDGRITCAQAPEGGALFRLELPVVKPLALVPS